jgi:UDP-2-acetamido-3-amino-2,3-dideoxy-glucuronate N-acetyltransferase
MNRSELRLGFVGAGYWGQKLLPKFLARSDAVVRSVCDLHAANRAAITIKFPGVRTTGSFEGLVSDPEIDAIIIVTPPATHYALAKRALQAGKHVWVEKPLALCVEEGRALVELGRTRNRLVFVDHTFLYDPAVRILREMILRRELGDIYHLNLQRLNLGRIKRDSNVWWNSAPHDASLVLFLLPAAPRSVRLHGYRYLQRNLEDLNMAVIEMADGASVFVYDNWLYPENTAKLAVIGSKQMAVYEGKFVKRSIAVYGYEVGSTAQPTPGPTGPTTLPSRIISERQLEGFESQEPLAAAATDFIESVLENRAPLSDGDFSLKVLAVLEAGERSLRRNGEKMTVEL